MNTAFLMGFGNKARHGKDWMANEIHCLLPRQTVVMSLATPMKMWARVSGFMHVKDGPFLQRFGTDCVRDRVNQDFWVEQLDKWIQEIQPEVVLVPDIRFVNEARYIKNQGGLLVNVRRVNADGSLYVAGDRDPKHPSETDLDDWAWDRVVQATSGDLETLRRAAIDLACLILAKRPALGLEMLQNIRLQEQVRRSV